MPNIVQEMVWEECCKCGIAFGVTAAFQRRRVADKRTFYCPEGHPIHYVGKSDRELLRQERDRAARIQSELDQKSAALRDAYNGLPEDLLVAKGRAACYNTPRQTAWWNGYRDAECGKKAEESSGYPAAFGWHRAWLDGFRLRREQMGLEDPS